MHTPDQCQNMAEGLNGDAIAALYRDLVNHFIAEEMKHWQQSQQT